MANIDIRTIKILLDTNIPGKEIIPLTKSILYEPGLKDTGNWNQYPYFTMEAAYPESYLTGLPHDEQLEFFFNKSKMNSILLLRSKNKTKGVESTKLKTNMKLEEEKKQEQTHTEKEDQIKQSFKLQREQLEKEKEKETPELSEAEIREIENFAIAKVGGSTKTFLTEVVKETEEKYQTATTNLLKLVEEMQSKQRIKNIFSPESPQQPVDEDGLFTDDFCKSSPDFRQRIFKNIPYDPNTTIFWDRPSGIDSGSSYKQEILNQFESIKSMPFFSKIFPLCDSIIERIQSIAGSSQDKDIEIQQQVMCMLLPRVRQVFRDIQPFLTDIVNVLKNNYPKEVNDALENIVKDVQKQKQQKLGEKKKEMREQFEKRMNDLYASEQAELQKITPTEKEPMQAIIEMVEHDQNAICENNIMVMLRIMFPTKYPTVGNILSSFHSVVTGKNEFHLKWTDFLPGFLKQKVFEGLSDYSYIQLDGTVYTVTQAIWLNDIYNHKEYGKLIQQYEELQKWKEKEIAKNILENGKKKESFKRTYANSFSTTDVDIIRQTGETVDKKGEIYDSTRLLEYTNLIKTVTKQIADFIRNSNIGNTDVVIQNATSIVKLLRDLMEDGRYRRWFITDNVEKYREIVQRMSRDLEAIQLEEYVLKNYLQRPGIQIEKERDNTKVRQLLREKYGVYSRFVENIRKYRAPILESSNFHLQTSIEDFLNNTEKYPGVFNFLINPLNVKKNPYSDLLLKTPLEEHASLEKEAHDYEKRLNTGVTIRPSAQGNEPYFEIYVQLNLIGGEVNDNNKASVDCTYQGESLQDRLSRLLNEALYHPWNINNSRIFFDITKGEVLDKTASSIPSITSETPVTEKKIGGKKSIRKYRKQFMKTRRVY